MGACGSSDASASASGAASVTSGSGRPLKISDNFKTFKEVQQELRKRGLEQCNLIVGIDCTKSNTWQGEKTFGGKSLHDVTLPQTPYERVLHCIGSTLTEFDDDKLIPLLGFGDSATRDVGVFNFRGSGMCFGFGEALSLYRQVIPRIQLAGPTSFAPVINEAVKIVQSEGGYHILLIIADGAVEEKQETIDAIVRASSFPLSIVVVGVGDGPWDTMEKFDDEIPRRKFDNLQFVNATQIFSDPRLESPETAFAMNALMEIPEQYKYLKSNALIRPTARRANPAASAPTQNASAPPPY